MTAIIIYSVFALLVIYDIVAVILQNKEKFHRNGIVTITSVMRRLYTSPLVTFMAGGIFIGHFLLYKYVIEYISKYFIGKSLLVLFIFLSSGWLVWVISEKLIKKHSKFYLICSRVGIIPMAIGALVGSLWI